MNHCRKHQQDYPQTGFCVYCGRPDEGLAVVPSPRDPLLPGERGTAGWYCPACFGWVAAGWDAHVCSIQTIKTGTSGERGYLSNALHWATGGSGGAA